MGIQVDDHLGALQVLTFLARGTEDECPRARESLEVAGGMPLAARDQEQHGVSRGGLAKPLCHLGGDVVAARRDGDTLALRKGLEGLLDAGEDLSGRRGPEPALRREPLRAVPWPGRRSRPRRASSSPPTAVRANASPGWETACATRVATARVSGASGCSSCVASTSPIHTEQAWITA